MCAALVGVTSLPSARWYEFNELWLWRQCSCVSSEYEHANSEPRLMWLFGFTLCVQFSAICITPLSPLNPKIKKVGQSPPDSCLAAAPVETQLPWNIVAWQSGVFDPFKESQCHHITLYYTNRLQTRLIESNVAALLLVKGSNSTGLNAFVWKRWSCIHIMTEIGWLKTGLLIKAW